MILPPPGAILFPYTTLFRSQLIEPILDREGLEFEVRANEVAWHPDGWRATFRNGDACGTCGEPCKRADVTSADAIGMLVDRKSTRLNSSHTVISYAVFCLKK